MTDATDEKSRFLSLVLRHRPDLIGIELDEAGWTPVDRLLDALTAAGRATTRAELACIVATSDKQRFALDPSRGFIRANQGHSLRVDLGLAAVCPPRLLLHGSAKRFVASIARQGLRRGRRHHVHLHANAETAKRVGRRHGAPVVFEIDAAAMHGAGFVFHVSANGVWLTEHVPPAYLINLPALVAADAGTGRESLHV